jgi:hypothetical protein
VRLSLAVAEVISLTPRFNEGKNRGPPKLFNCFNSFSLSEADRIMAGQNHKERQQAHLREFQGVEVPAHRA